MPLERTIRVRETWLKCYEEPGSVSKAALKCGIPRSTLYRWIKRVELVGKDGLKEYSERPKTLIKEKITQELVDLIKSIRTEFGFGPQRISLHLLRMHNKTISGPTVWLVLKENNMPNIKNTESITILYGITDLFQVIEYRSM
jgi:transposase